MQNYDDKIWNLDGEKLLAIGGEHSDILVFGDYIQKNLAFMKYKNGYGLSTDDTAQFIRSQLAEAIRKGPYSVNCLLAGFEGEQPRLYWIDYLGSVIETSKACHGYAEYLVSSVMDTLQTSDLTEEEGLKIIDKCLNSMRDRFVISQSSFSIKVVRKDGIRVVREAAKPQGAF
jgi:20S proteasome subunit beta 4